MVVVVVVGVDVNVDGDGDGDGRRNDTTSAQRGRTCDMLSFQRLDVYRCAIELLALSTRLPQRLPKGHFVLADQRRGGASARE